MTSSRKLRALTQRRRVYSRRPSRAFTLPDNVTSFVSVSSVACSALIAVSSNQSRACPSNRSVCPVTVIRSADRRIGCSDCSRVSRRFTKRALRASAVCEARPSLTGCNPRTDFICGGHLCRRPRPYFSLDAAVRPRAANLCLCGSLLASRWRVFVADTLAAASSGTWCLRVNASTRGATCSSQRRQPAHY